MAKKRIISYEAMANLAVIGGVISLAAALAVALLPEPESGSVMLADAAGTAGTIAWLLGAAAGVLSLSTPFAKRAITGLVLCGIVLAAVVISAVTRG